MMSPAQHRGSGFSLVELTAVLTVTFVIGALGMSAYRTYSVRAVIAASVESVRTVETDVANAFKRDGVPPATLEDLRAAPLTGAVTLIDFVRVENGRIEVRFASSAHGAISGRSLYLTPYETIDQRVVWVCGNAVPGVGLNPLGFAGGARQAVQALTQIEPRFLPPSCR